MPGLRAWVKRRLRKDLETYRGNVIGCAPGTHRALVDLARAHVSGRAGVLDLGAHSGALLLRLADAGFEELAGADRDVTLFKATDARFYHVDLEEDFASRVGGDYALITATDVIEHLTDPRGFLAALRPLLRPDGCVALSFPNVAFWEGRIKFLLKGELWGFGRRNYAWQRHISPMTLDQTDLMLREIGYEPLEVRTKGSFATVLRWIVLSPLWIPLRLIGGPSTLGESVVLIARKAESDATLAMPKDYEARWAASGPAENHA